MWVESNHAGLTSNCNPTVQQNAGLKMPLQEKENPIQNQDYLRAG